MTSMPVSADSATPRSDDRTTIGVQDGMARLASTQEASTDFAPLANDPVRDAEVLRGAASARAYLAQADVPENTFEPDMLSVWGAYFRSENTVGSILSSETVANALFPTPDSPKLSTEALINRIEADKLAPYQHNFVGVETVADYEAAKAQLNREIEDKRIMAAAGGLNSVAAGLAAGVIDLPSLLPGALGWKLGAAGVNMGKASLSVAAGATLGSSVSEIALQASQRNRTLGESAASVGGSIILGGMLGGALHGIAYRTLGPAAVRTVEERMEKTVADLAGGGEGVRSAGAAHLSAYERMRAEGIDSQRSINSWGANESLKALGDIPGFIGRGFRIPMLDLENTKSPSALAALNGLVYRPGITGANIAGEAATGSPVVAFVRDYRDELVKITEDSDGLFKQHRSAFKDYADFDEQVARQLISPKETAHPAIVETAAKHRKVYTQIVDELIEAKVLPASVKEKYGENYFPMIFDADAIRANESGFKGMIAEGFTKQFVAEAEEALRQQLGRVQQNIAKREEIVGKVEKTGKTDDAGAPVINPKTGKQVQTRKVIKEGEQLERERISKEQYELRKDYLDEQRELTVETHTKETNEILATVNRIYDESRSNVASEFTDAFDRAARASDTPAQRAKLSRQLNAEQKRRLDALEAERRSSLETVRTTQRRTLKEKVGPIDADLKEAKTIRDDAIAHAKGLAKERLSEEIVSTRKGLEDGLRFVRDGKVDPAKVREEAQNLAERWYKSTTEWNKFTLDHELDGFTEFLKKRKTPVAHSDLLDAGFVRGNAYSILEDYTRMAGTDAAVARTFKKSVKEKGPDGKATKDSDLVQVGDLRLKSVKEDIVADYDALKASLFDGPEFKAKEAALEKKYEKLVKAAKTDDEKGALAAKFQDELGAAKSEVEKGLATQRDNDIANLDAVLDSIRGTSKSGASQSFKNAAEIVSSVNYMRLLGGTTVSSLGDPIKIAMSVGFGNTTKGAMLAYQQTFASSWKTANAAEKGLSRAGAAMAELHLSARLASLADIGNPHRVDSTSVNFMRKASQVFSKVSLITYWNGFWKQVSENATTAYLGQLAHKGPDKLSKSERAWLASLRIDDDGLRSIKAAHEAQVGDKFYDDLPMMMHEDWADKQAAMIVRHAVGEELNNHVITPQGYDRMSFATTPAGRVLFQFRQHMVSNQMRFIGRQAQLASIDSERTVGLAVGVASLITAGAMIDALKQMTGQWSPAGNLDRNKSPIERVKEEWEKTPGLALWNSLDRSDTLGIVMEGSNILDKMIGFGPKSAVTFFDDKAAAKEASRFKNRSKVDVLAGPTGGLVNDVFNAAGGLKKVISGDKLSRGDYRSAERLIPGQNIPYIQWMGNAVERSVGDLYSWPNPK